MHYITLIFASIVCGVISSSPPGPINLLLADRVLAKRLGNLSYFLFGIIFIDVVFAFFAFWGYYTFFSESKVGKSIAIGGAILLILLGIISFIKARKDSNELLSQKKQYEKISAVQQFLSGAFLCGSNPGFIIWWTLVATQFQKLGVEEVSIIEFIIISIGIAIGDLVWFKSYIRLLKYGSKKIKEGFIQKIRLGVASILILLGLITIISTILS